MIRYRSSTTRRICSRTERWQLCHQHRHRLARLGRNHQHTLLRVNSLRHEQPSQHTRLVNPNLLRHNHDRSQRNSRSTRIVQITAPRRQQRLSIHPRLGSRKTAFPLEPTSTRPGCEFPENTHVPRMAKRKMSRPCRNRSDTP